MLSSGLTLIFSMMGVLNFAHASFYMLGAYFAYTHLRRGRLLAGAVHRAAAGRRCSAPRSSATACAACTSSATCPSCWSPSACRYLILELVQLVWGRLDRALRAAAAAARGRCSRCSARSSRMSRVFMMLVAVLMLIAIWLLLTRTRIGLVIQAALTHPETVEALGPQRAARVHAGVRRRRRAGRPGRRDRRQHLRHRAGAWRPRSGSIIFVVVVVGGMGSLAGRLPGVAADRRHPDLRRRRSTSRCVGAAQRARRDRHAGDLRLRAAGSSSISQIAPILPYLFLVLILIFRPKGLLGTREG